MTNTLTTPDSRAEKIMKRYRGAYRVAKATSVIGTLIKFIGLFVALVIPCLAWALPELATIGGGNYYLPVLVAACTLGILVGLLFFFFGTLVASQGQILRASIDDAANTSPFLSDDQRFQLIRA